ncbi:MAG: DNA primase [Caulobacter sp.]|nr:DNA primase [Caulobacter sp.]
MRFDDRFLEEIKSRLRLSDVIGKTVKLKRQGREFVGLSPFTKERSPSFFVNDDKGFFHDFSSGKHGDLISFLQETERLSFVEAVERLAGEAGMQMPAPDPQAAEQEKKRQGLSDWLDLAASWFEGELRRPAGREARDYLVRRGLAEEHWSRFRIGFSPPGRTALKDYLIAKGARAPELVDAGLLVAPEDGSAPYDRFRDRIIFPIIDQRGRTVSFGGRAMDPEARAKYLNGPETSLFSKGRLLYGLPEARKLLHSGGVGAALVVVEGYMDAIACQRAGIAAVAPLGTALTEEQMEVLWRLHPEPTLSFDGDSAGQRAAHRTIDRALPLLGPERTLKFALVKGGKDPDDVLRDQGPLALREQMAQTTPLVEALFLREREAAGVLDTPERKVSLKARLRTLAATIADKDLARAYKDDLLDRYEGLWPLKEPVTTVSGLGRAMARQRWDKRKGNGVSETPRFSDVTPEGRVEAQRLKVEPKPMLAALAIAAIRDPRVVQDRLEVLGSQGFGDEQLDQIANEIVALQVESEGMHPELLRRRLAVRGFDDDALRALERTAKRAGEPLFVSEAPDTQLRAIWATIFDLMLNVRTLEKAVEQAKNDLAQDADSSTLMTLKAKRDGFRRDLELKSWRGEPETGATLH